MSAKNFFIVQGILCFLFGVLHLFSPQMVADMYSLPKIDTSGALDTVLRVYGTMLMGIGLISLSLRDLQASPLRRNMFIIPIGVNIVLAFIHIRAMSQGVENSMGWSTVLISAVFIVWSGFLLVKEKT